MDVEPSPKSQDQLVGEPPDASVNETSRGAMPLVGLALKSATGADETGATMLVSAELAVAEPAAFVAVTCTRMVLPTSAERRT